MIEILLGIFVLVSGFLIWYVIKLIRKFLNISEELEGLFVLIEEYTDHIDKVYNLERFYGDTTLENLMRHSKTVAETAKNFRAIYDVNYDYDLEDADGELGEE